MALTNMRHDQEKVQGFCVKYVKWIFMFGYFGWNSMD